MHALRHVVDTCSIDELTVLQRTCKSVSHSVSLCVSCHGRCHAVCQQNVGHHAIDFFCRQGGSRIGNDATHGLKALRGCAIVDERAKVNVTGVVENNDP